MKEKFVPKFFTRDEFCRLVSNKDTRSRIQGFPETAYGDDNSDYGVARYDFSATAVKMSNGQHNFMLAYQGIKAGRIDTLIYVGPSTDLEKLTGEIVEKLEDVDY